MIDKKYLNYPILFSYNVCRFRTKVNLALHIYQRYRVEIEIIDKINSPDAGCSRAGIPFYVSCSHFVGVKTRQQQQHFMNSIAEKRPNNRAKRMGRMVVMAIIPAL